MALNRFSFISFELFSLAKIYFDVAVRFNFLATKEENIPCNELSAPSSLRALVADQMQFLYYKHHGSKSRKILYNLVADAVSNSFIFLTFVSVCVLVLPPAINKFQQWRAGWWQVVIVRS
jgi:hypothetical protein